MIEIKKSNEFFGVFEFCLTKTKIGRATIADFIQKKGYCILTFGETDDCISSHEIIQRTQQKNGWTYVGILIIQNRAGMDNFKDTFHRSSSYVDDKMISSKHFKDIFEEAEIKDFFANVIQQRTQIKGMNKILIRSKKLEEIK